MVSPTRYLQQKLCWRYHNLPLRQGYVKTTIIMMQTKICLLTH